MTANILHITCSARAEESQSTRFSYRIVERLQPAGVTLRDLTWAPLPHVDSAYAHALAGRPPGEHNAPHLDSLARSEQLIAELDAAHAIVIGLPMHNYTIPSCLKAWVDHVLRIGHTFAPSPEGKRGLLRDRPVYIAVASGGFFTGAKANQPDFVTPYLQAALNTMGLRTLHFFALQGLVFGPERVAQAWSEATAALDAVLAPASAAAAIA
ncbi:acyl carrier protein phosphodiesterase [Acidovorax sp. CF316]|uniref:FMN-dependent NADH-azoreductase n=1 Tax=Acidovorax sp. CF316 TaxID=1144317 RepID=UPI00026BCC07|nr:NAD(P)H-dependent oxidoreductase [Acidovorax sp. CF316]EJE49625.1 acyl carrier protein phosphodiesterase [Acidovorax sp. CF316]